MNKIKNIEEVIKMINEVFYSVIIPLYNKELIIGKNYIRLKKVMDYTKENYEIIFINNEISGSTNDILEDICNKDKKIKFVNLSNYLGHQSVLNTGIDLVSGSAVIVIDAELKDSPEDILKMIIHAFHEITTFSWKPFVIISYFGVSVFLIGVLSFLIFIIKYITTNGNILNFSLVLSINIILLGLLVCSIGLMGQYIGSFFYENTYILNNTLSCKKLKKKTKTI